MKIHFETLGCRLNHDESEGAARAFSLQGFVPDMEGVTSSTAEDSETVLCVINTCTVTGKAEQKARRLIRLMLQKYPFAPIIVTGCYAELDASSIKSICPDRIAVLAGTKKYLLAAIAVEMNGGVLSIKNGSFSLERLEQYIQAAVSGNGEKSMRRVSPVTGLNVLSNDADETSVPHLDIFSLYTPVFEKHSRGSIKVQDGCNCACAFCRIHLARGKSVSLSPEEVVSRVKEMEDGGMNEVVFTGVNLSQYSAAGKDGKRLSFSDLLQLVIDSTSKILLRISSFYPQSVDDSLCAVLSNPRVQPFFHLSIQSGSDRILRLMNRPHSVEHVVRAIEKIRSVKDNPFISCDIIAGFPGESEEDFEKTMDLCRNQHFAWIHAFPFSPRPGTPAEKMRPQIPERIKGERVRLLTETARQGKIDYIKSWSGKTISAVVENSRAMRKSDGRTSSIHAVTANYLHIQCPCDEKKYRPGMSVKVTVGEPLEDNIRAGGEIDCIGSISKPNLC
ncbi:MAG TPA: tRNA (N(6)-L-threonylcarbamoyladenosine(37)-C(2))-methylthiotransferase MtaB [Treponema sp.]|nr:tRNA (N(6)-L-threonylcarbamoyladenosine(37)-C(2))-methylthiotransferase MtaB [Treponema sp.]